MQWAKAPGKVMELRLAHYRAFTSARLVLDDVTFLVGRNGAGKSTLLDAFDFLREAVTDTLLNALERRDGLTGVRQVLRAPNTSRDFSLAVKVDLGDDTATYGCCVAPRRGGSSFRVKRESLTCRHGRSFDRRDDAYRADPMPDTDFLPVPIVDPEALVLPQMASTDPGWQRVLATVAATRAYRISPTAIRAEPTIGSSVWLETDGANAGDVLRAMGADDQRWLLMHLAQVTPGMDGIRADAAGGRRRLLFDQGQNGGRHAFPAAAMSDGTLRCLGVLLALRQRERPSLVCLDEIEDSIHPAGLAVLLDAIEASAQRCPVLVVSHSPEVLSHPSVTARRVRVVEWRDGESSIHHLSRGVVDALKPPESVGRLLRANALWTDEKPVRASAGFFA